MQDGGIGRRAARITGGALAGILALAGATVGHAQLVIYPAKGQSTEQQQKDHGECHVWAKNQTGVDPAALASQVPPPPSGPQGERVRGAARGAAAGAIGGAIGGNAGKGAAIGAGVGTAAGGMRQRRERRAEAGQAQQAAGAQQAQMAQFNKAYAACLEGRGYTVK